MMKPTRNEKVGHLHQYIKGHTSVLFREKLLSWSLEHPRPMPWRGERDPYKIWLSEVILQQTRVEQGIPYYQKFVSRFPNIFDLARVEEDEFMKLWEGLGYYSRARNLQSTAKEIVNEMNGRFPNTYTQIRSLKGVGNYTAAAIASFAFDLPYAVLDGNVYRILARYFGIPIPLDTTTAQRVFAEIAQDLLDPDQPALFNQAIMDFGAICCTPQQPGCKSCPFSGECQALKLGIVNELPVKSRALVKKKRFFQYLVFNHLGDVFIRKRIEKDIWRGLWEFPQSETPLALQAKQISPPFRQLLTHQEITAVFYEINLHESSIETMQPSLLKDCMRIPRKDLKKNIAFPKVIDRYLESNVLTLGLDL